MFDSARAHSIKIPKIKLTDLNGNPIKFSLAGPSSRYTGQIMVTDGGPFGANKYYGRIDGTVFHFGRDLVKDSPVFEQIKMLAENPADTAKAYGRRTGNCCFCARELTDATSIKVGYGEICAGRYGMSYE
jgi:hypothetical protein